MKHTTQKVEHGLRGAHNAEPEKGMVHGIPARIQSFQRGFERPANRRCPMVWNANRDSMGANFSLSELSREAFQAVWVGKALQRHLARVLNAFEGHSKTDVRPVN